MDEKLTEYIYQDIDTFISEFKRCHSKSKFFELYEEYKLFLNMCELIGFDDLPNLDYYFHKSYDSQLDSTYIRMENQTISKFEANIELYQQIAKLYDLKKYCPIYYSTDSESNGVLIPKFLRRTTKEEIREVVTNFLNVYDKNLNNYYLDQRNKVYIYYLENILPEGFFGTTFLNYAVNKAYIFIKRLFDIEDAFTTVHELGHSYSFYRTKYLYPNPIRTTLYKDVYDEVYSNFLELILADFLISNPLYSEDIKIIEQSFDINLLEFLESFNEILNQYDESMIDLGDFRSIYSNTISKIIAYHFYDMYQKDQEKAKYNINKFMLNSPGYDSIKRIEECDINPDELTNPNMLKKYFKKHFKN